jgi:hypothetical protein
LSVATPHHISPNGIVLGAPLAKRRAQQGDMFGEKPGVPFGQIDDEEAAAAGTTSRRWLVIVVPKGTADGFRCGPPVLRTLAATQYASTRH